MSPRRTCQTCALPRNADWFTGPRGTICKKCRARTARYRYVQKTYGLTREQYDALVVAQGNACAICKGSRGYELNVDHDHTITELPDAVRGLLCRRCNKILSQVRDVPQLLRALAEYLENPPARKVLNETPPNS